MNTGQWKAVSGKEGGGKLTSLPHVTGQKRAGPKSVVLRVLSYEEWGTQIFKYLKFVEPRIHVTFK